LSISHARRCWYLSRIIGGERAVGLVVGTYVAAAGWRLLMAPVAA
jgi:hypothetical protein